MTKSRQKDVNVEQQYGYSEDIFLQLIDKVEEKDCPICGERKLIVDLSMSLIQCDSCGISFEYRYDRGIIPFHTIIGAGSS